MELQFSFRLDWPLFRLTAGLTPETWQLNLRSVVCILTSVTGGYNMRGQRYLLRLLLFSFVIPVAAGCGTSFEPRALEEVNFLDRTNQP